VDVISAPPARPELKSIQHFHELESAPSRDERRRAELSDAPERRGDKAARNADADAKRPRTDTDVNIRRARAGPPLFGACWACQDPAEAHGCQATPRSRAFSQVPRLFAHRPPAVPGLRACAGRTLAPADGAPVMELEYLWHRSDAPSACP
jgi:hypothetical protein